MRGFQVVLSHICTCLITAVCVCPLDAKSQLKQKQLQDLSEFCPCTLSSPDFQIDYSLSLFLCSLNSFPSISFHKKKIIPNKTLMPERVLGQRDMGYKVNPWSGKKNLLAAKMLPTLIVQGQILCMLKHNVRTDKLIETMVKHTFGVQKQLISHFCFAHKELVSTADIHNLKD